jgi:hypothetical protein
VELLALETAAVEFWLQLRATIDLLAYVLASIKQLLENLSIYFATDFVKYFRI